MVNSLNIRLDGKVGMTMFKIIVGIATLVIGAIATRVFYIGLA